MKIKLNQVAKLKAGMDASEGSQRVVKDASGNETIVFTPFRYSGKVIWNRMKNSGLIAAKAREIEELRLALVRKHAEGATDVPPKNLEIFFADFKEATEHEEDVPLLAFKPDDFNLFDPSTNKDGNVIPASVMLLLEPLISFDP